MMERDREVHKIMREFAMTSGVAILTAQQTPKKVIKILKSRDAGKGEALIDFSKIDLTESIIYEISPSPNKPEMKLEILK